MKKIIFSLIILFAMVSCEDKTKDVETFKPDPNATILIRGVKTRAQLDGLSNLDIVTNALNIKWESHWAGNTHWDDAKEIGRSFIPDHKDYDNELLKMWAIDIISNEGEYQRDFIHGFNVVITDANNDTIAYVPNEVINVARVKIEAAFKAGEYEQVYDLFNTAFTFLPIETVE